MATPDTRTTTDDAADALAHIEAAEREMVNLRAHLQRAVQTPAPGHAHQARRSAGIIEAELERAAAATANLMRRSWRDQVRLVS